MSALATHVRYAIIGAGFGGIGAALRLDRDLGQHDWLILERGSEVGGTWWANTYPGAECDIPSNLYSFSFALNPDWHKAYAPQAEIRDYLIAISDRYNLRKRIAFNTTVTAARWERTTERWQITTTNGTVSARYLIAAPGLLSEPQLPAIEGLESFGGEIVHTAAWREGIATCGRRVAIVGSGASAIQAAPKLAERAAQLTIFQRTAPWIMPHFNRTIPARERALKRRLPWLQRLMRASQYAARETLILGFVYRPALQSLLEAVADCHRRRQVADRSLRARLRPTYRLGCKRVLPSNSWYPTLQRPNVTLVEHGVRSLTQHGLIATDGSYYDADVIVFATGFNTTEMPLAAIITGADGSTLSAVWDGSPQAHHGITVAGFPNMFLLAGPNTSLGTNSIVFMIEAQLNYLIDGLRRVSVSEAVIDVDPYAQAVSEAERQRRAAHTVWARGRCGSSWYMDARGHISALWPDFTCRYWAKTRRFDADNYRLCSSRR